MQQPSKEECSREHCASQSISLCVPLCATHNTVLAGTFKVQTKIFTGFMWQKGMQPCTSAGEQRCAATFMWLQQRQENASSVIQFDAFLGFNSSTDLQNSRGPRRGRASGQGNIRPGPENPGRGDSFSEPVQRSDCSSSAAGHAAQGERLSWATTPAVHLEWGRNCWAGLVCAWGCHSESAAATLTHPAPGLPRRPPPMQLRAAARRRERSGGVTDRSGSAAAIPPPLLCCSMGAYLAPTQPVQNKNHSCHGRETQRKSPIRGRYWQYVILVAGSLRCQNPSFLGNCRGCWNAEHPALSLTVTHRECWLSQKHS